jgi:hypothetical protein
MNRRVIRDVADAAHIMWWISESREENRARLEQETDRDEVLRLQGENRALNLMIDKIPKDE